MARIETDPNYSSPTFSRATAGTDLFKKEDVQALAAAVSTHDHTSGKGLILPAAAIPPITSAMIQDGTITSADILDGTIATADLADGAVTTAKIGLNQIIGQAIDVPISSNFSTTSTNTWVDTNVGGTGSFTGLGNVLVLFSLIIQHSVSNAIIYFGWGLDGVIQRPMGFVSPHATAGFPQQYMSYGLMVPLSGSHRLSIMINNSTPGTASFRSEAYSQLTAWEFKR